MKPLLVSTIACAALLCSSVAFAANANDAQKAISRLRKNPAIKSARHLIFSKNAA
ncbi:hypothetical protein AB4090_13720 [Acidithiobacillus sp. IBUN Pt1247-S3]